VGAAFAAVAIVFTPASASPGANAGAAVVGQQITVGGKPFFPVMLLDQCTAQEAANAAALGINLIVNESCPGVASSAQLAALGAKSLLMLPIADRAARGRTLVGWAYPDEPENNGWSPDQLARSAAFPRGGADGELSVMTTGAGFVQPAGTPNTPAPDVYRRFARLADVAGFDLYPLGHCNPNIGAVFDAQRAFRRLVGRMPTFQWIETGPIRPEYCGGFRMTPAQLNAEVWLAVAAGARGIGYFTHTWAPAHKAFDVQPAIVAQIARTDRLLAAVLPALTGVTVPSSVNTTSVRVLARRAGTTTYVVVVNVSTASIRMKFKVPSLRAGNLKVVGENRAVSASQGQVDDGLDPLGVHVYAQVKKVNG
jgi:hypothetical protein